MRKLLSIGILSAFLFLMGGYLITWQIIMNNNRAAMMVSVKQGASHQNSISIALSKKEAMSFVDGNEITWKHHRYDIVKIENKGEKVLIIAISDTYEDQLIAMFGAYQVQNEKTPCQSHSNINLLNDFFKEYTGGLKIKMNPNPNPVFVTAFPYQNGILLKGHPEISSPPPESEI